MISVDIFLIVVAFGLSYLAILLYNSLTVIGDGFSDWISIFMGSAVYTLITFGLLLLTFFIINHLSKHLYILLTNKSASFLSWEKWQAVILCLLIFDLYFYLFINLSWLLLIPLLISWSVKFLLQLPKEQRSIQYKKSYY